LQPYRFLVIDSAEVRQQLLPLSWNQAQVVDASHYIVLTIQKGFALPQIDHMLERVAEVRGVGLETLDGYKKFMVGDLVEGPRSAKIDTWASNQTYIAYGTIMATAALLGIDACPLEGFQPDKYDELLGLEAKGLHAVAALALGYRDSSDKYATLPKVRLPQSEIITHI
jgi:nitroreductase